MKKEKSKLIIPCVLGNFGTETSVPKLLLENLKLMKMVNTWFMWANDMGLNGKKVRNLRINEENNLIYDFIDMEKLKTMQKETGI